MSGLTMTQKAEWVLDQARKKSRSLLSDLNDLEDDQYLTAHDLQIYGRANAIVGTFSGTAGLLL
jgi:hypothetical protein